MRGMPVAAECVFDCGSGVAAGSEPRRTKRSESRVLGEGAESSPVLVARVEDNDANSKICVCIDARDDFAAIWRSRFGAGTHWHGRTSTHPDIQNSAGWQNRTLHYYGRRKS